MAILKEKYQTVAIPALKEQFAFTNQMMAPKIVKVTINAGLGKGKDAKFADIVVDTLKRISGQAPVQTKARKSIAGFKLREGQIVGAMVTLRGARMWDFLDKLALIAFARIRDFRGISESAVDKDGNFNIGLTEHTSFPEVRPDEVESLHGLQITISTTANNREEGLVLFKALGFPFVSTKAKS